MASDCGVNLSVCVFMKNTPTNALHMRKNNSSSEDSDYFFHSFDFFSFFSTLLYFLFLNRSLLMFHVCLCGGTKNGGVTW